MENKKRITIRCWNAPACGREYSWLATFDGRPTLLIACPFCGKEAVVRLNPYETPERIISAGDEDAFTLRTLNLPDVVPSEQRPADES